MRRRWRILLGLVLVGALASLVLALAAGPWLQGRLTAAAQQAGYHDASVGAVRLGLWSATVRDVVLVPGGGLSCAAIDVTWTWSELRHGRVADLRISGLAAVVPTGPLGPEVRGLLPTSSSTSSTAWPTTLPVGRFSLAGVVRVAGLDLPLNLHANDLGGGSAWFNAQAGSATTGQVELRGTVGPDGADVAVHAQAVPVASWIAALLPASATAAWASSATAVTGLADLNTSLQWDGQDLSVTGDLTIAKPTGQGDDGGGWSLTADHATLSGSLWWKAATALRSECLLSVAGLTLELPGAKLSMHGLTGSLPITSGRTSGLRGQLRADLIRYQDVTLPGVRFEAALIDGRMHGSAVAALAGVLPLTVATTIDLDQPLTDLHVWVIIPRTEVADAHALARAVPACEPWLISGAVSMGGFLTWEDDHFVPFVQVNLNDALIINPDQDLQLDGLNAGLRIINLDPLVTSPNQVTNIRRLRWKDQFVEHLEAAVTVLPGHITAQHCALAWAGGTVAIPRLEVVLPTAQLAGSASGAVTVRGVDLDRVLALAAPGRAVGAGRLSGQMPLQATWPPTAVTLGEGRLFADPPEGWVRILDRAAITAAIGTGGVTDAALRVRVVDAVQEFSFNRFELTTSRVQGELLTRAEAAGRGRTGKDPLEIGSLVFRIHGLEDGLAQALRLSAGSPPPAPQPADDLDHFFDP